ncbi:MAG: hypothetical protein HOU01_08585 [Streptomycetaceae bacterium]|nr:hypothetical protein [Streptomycetaceae bacterium]
MTTPLESDDRTHVTDPERPTSPPSSPFGRLTARARALNPFDVLAMAVPTLILAIMGWDKRWMTDDGLIFTRAVKQIVDGNGPVYNIGERTETSTSTLWQWVLALVDLVTPGDIAAIAVYLGLALSVGGFWIALNATRRLYRGLAVKRFLIPAGALVFVAIPSIWDFLTAGMETGLIIFWIAVSWSLLVSAWQTPEGAIRLRRVLGTSAWYGLGPLVRPDLGLAMMVFLAALALLTRARWTRCIGMLAVAGALPAAYEIFRMGYYGLIFPMPALTKEAGESLWGRGWDYLTDYNRPYKLWIPLLLLAVVAALLLRVRRPGNRTWIVVAAPLTAAFVQTFYVIKVGGDFMHGRMWMPVLLMLLLPLLLTPLDKLATPVVAGIAVWAVICGSSWRSGIITTDSPLGNGQHQVWNERDFYTNETKTDNPVTVGPHIRTIEESYDVSRKALADGRRVLILDPNYARAYNLPVDFALPLRTDVDFPVGLVIGRLGVGGAVMPLDGIVADVWGLSNTIGAHIDQTNFAAAGHQKLLPPAWNFALYVDPAAWSQIPDNFLSAKDRERGVTMLQLVNAANHTMQCGDVKELVDSVTKPLTFGRFWDNLTGAYDRTKLRIPADPIAAEQKFCK